jgi:hypothetical protein
MGFVVISEEMLIKLHRHQGPNKKEFPARINILNTIIGPFKFLKE